MDLNTHLSFDGRCEEAFRFYAEILHGAIEMKLTYGETPMAAQTPPDSRNRIAHIRMRVGGAVLMGADAPPGFFSKPQGFTVSIGIKESDEAERIFNELSVGGEVRMPIQETFWARRFGMFVDRFGIPWMVNCEKEP